MAIRSLIRERFFPHLWCPGCGHGHVLNAMLHSVDDLGYDPSSLVMVSGIGCSARIAGYVDFHAVNGGSNPPGDAKNFNRLQQLSFWVTKIGLQFFLRRLSLEEFLF